MEGATAGMSVQVAVRIRPLNANEMSVSATHHIHARSAVQLNAGNDNAFSFDYIFGPSTDQSAIYDDSVFPLIGAAFEGFNATVFAYGQTGSGEIR